MKSRLAFASAAALAAVAIEGTTLDVAKSFIAAPSTSNGKIAFSDAPASDEPPALPSDLYVIDPDGTKRQRLSQCRDRNCVVRAFAWSPNGRRLAFLRGTMGGVSSAPDLALYIVDADGQRQRRLPGCGKPRWP